MSQAPQFVISEFTNPSGEIVFRLTGWLDGKRIRKNFPSRAEAALSASLMHPSRSRSTWITRSPTTAPLIAR
jgi:hypothetical protein